MADSAAVSARDERRPAGGRRHIDAPGEEECSTGRTLAAAARATRSGRTRWASSSRRASSTSNSASGSAVGTRDRDQDVIDPGRHLREEPPQPIEVRRVERRDAGLELKAGAMHALGIASRDDHGSSLAVGPPCCLEPDARAAADHEDRLTGELGFATHVGAQSRRWTTSSHQGDSLVPPRRTRRAKQE